jgi:hypothetical protein
MATFSSTAGAVWGSLAADSWLEGIRFDKSYWSDETLPNTVDDGTAPHEKGETLLEMQPPSQKTSWPLIVMLIIVALLLLLLFANSLRKGGSGSTSSLDLRTIAYGQAQQAQNYRKNHPSARNYCVVSLYVEDTMGTVTAGPGGLFFGFGQNSNENHCEQRALAWVAQTGLPSVFRRFAPAGVEALHVVLFTQVRACTPCVQSFQSWEHQLQQQVATQQSWTGVRLHLYVWEITFGSASGFAPRDYPAGPFTPGPSVPNTRKPIPVSPGDLDQVYP